MEETENGPKMHWWEWAIVLCVAILVDIAQIILNIALGSGVLINRIISFAFGILLGGYLSLRGVSMVNTKRLLGFFTTFVIEEIPLLDMIPTWTIDVVWTWWTTKSKTIAKVTDKLNEASKMTSALNQNGARSAPPKIPMNQDGVRQPNKNDQQSKRSLVKSEDDNDTNREINVLKTQIDTWDKELQQLKIQIQKYNQEKKDFRNSVGEIIKKRRAEGMGDEELTKLEMSYLHGSMEMGTPEENREVRRRENEISSRVGMLRLRAKDLEGAIWGTKNKLIEKKTRL